MIIETYLLIAIILQAVSVLTFAGALLLAIKWYKLAKTRTPSLPSNDPAHVCMKPLPADKKATLKIPDMDPPPINIPDAIARIEIKKEDK
jgi:hypothetical protein